MKIPGLFRYFIDRNLQNLRYSEPDSEPVTRNQNRQMRRFLDYFAIFLPRIPGSSRRIHLRKPCVGHCMYVWRLGHKFWSRHWKCL